MEPEGRGEEGAVRVRRDAEEGRGELEGRKNPEVERLGPPL